MNKDNILSFTLIGFLIISLVVMTGCSEKPQPLVNNNMQDLSASQELKKFNSVEELKQFMSEHSNSDDFLSSRGGVMMDSAVGAKAEQAVSAPTANTAGSDGSSYSGTNVQIKGVDEADFVKNDGDYIYIISNGELVIIDARDGLESEILSSTKIPRRTQTYYGYNSVRDMFLNGDKVVVFTDSYEPSVYFDKYNIQPVESSRQTTKVFIYDVSDKSDPELSEEFSISGGYYSSRMIENVVYTVTQEYLYDWRYYEGPMIAHDKRVINPEIYYFDNPEQNYQMNTITSISLATEEVSDTMSFMLGYGNTLMVSEDNIYIAYQKQTAWCFGWRCSSYDEDARTRFVEVVVPLLEGDLKRDVQAVINKDLSEEEEWSQISEILSTFFEELMENEDLQDDYSDMFEDIEDALNDYDAKKALEDSKTIIHKIAIDDGDLEYDTKGEVEGTLLNQFSMDEFEGSLRVATSVNVWLRNDRLQYNNVYILDNELRVTGKLTDIAENESIYSTRFVGDKLYMVTFRQIDPFFVIDLSSTTDPKILGYLKIPGYSSYLHPINDQLIIGVGKDTGENEWGGVSTKGVKVTLFDISDFDDPKEIDTKVIGIEGSDSPILYDHKAFLYSSSRNMLVIPVTEVTERVRSGQYGYRSSVWYGAYVFEVSEEGFSDLGKIKHSSSETQYYYWNDAANVKRSLYIDNVLYTISDRYVKANDMDNDLEELNSIRLPFEEQNDISYPEKPIPVDIGGGIGDSVSVK